MTDTQPKLSEKDTLVQALDTLMDQFPVTGDDEQSRAHILIRKGIAVATAEVKRRFEQ